MSLSRGPTDPRLDEQLVLDSMRNWFLTRGLIGPLLEGQMNPDFGTKWSLTLGSTGLLHQAGLAIIVVHRTNHAPLRIFGMDFLEMQKSYFYFVKIPLSSFSISAKKKMTEEMLGENF